MNINNSLEFGIIKPIFMNEFMYEELQLQDHKIEPLIPWFQKCKVYIDNCLAQGGRILIHWYYFFK